MGSELALPAVRHPAPVRNRRGAFGPPLQRRAVRHGRLVGESHGVESHQDQRRIGDAVGVKAATSRTIVAVRRVCLRSHVVRSRTGVFGQGP